MKLNHILAGTLLAYSTLGYAQVQNAPQSCSKYEEMYSKSIDGKILDFASKRVLSQKNKDNKGYDNMKRCLGDLGFKIGEGVNEKDLIQYGDTMKVGKNCLRELLGYSMFAGKNGIEVTDVLEFEGSPKICLGFHSLVKLKTNI